MADWIRPLKIEYGDEIDSFPTEVNPADDGIICQGIAIENTSTKIEKDGSGNLLFTDAIVGSVTLSSLNSGGTPPDYSKTQFLLAYQQAYDTMYTEMVYTSGDLTQINIWEDNSKTTKLFTRDISYTTGNVTQVLTTDELTSETLTKSITYTIGGDVDTITTTFS